MSQININTTSGFQQPGVSKLGIGFDSQGNFVRINSDGSPTILASGDVGVPNIMANKGVGLEANLPTTGLVQGDVYATTDTFKIYTRQDAVSWSFVDMANSQFITDSLNVAYILYQYKDSVITVIGAQVSPQDWIDFVPQDPVPSHVEGRMFYDEIEKTWTLYNDIAGVSLQVGEELRARLTNDVGGDLVNGVAVSITGTVGVTLKVDLMDASDFNLSLRAFGLITSTIINGEQGYAVRYGLVRDINTAGCAVGSIVWADPENAGEYTNTRPSAPNYPIRIGICMVEDATFGAIAVDTLAFNGTDTSVNAEGIINGIATQTPQVDVSVSGGIIYADVTNEDFPTKNIPVLFNGTRYYLNTTTNTGSVGAARVIVPPGADANTLQESILYVYLNAGVPTLDVGTSAPSIPYVKICNLMVFDAVRTLADGKPDGYRRSNDAINLINGINDGAVGLVKDIMSAIREKLGSNWISGQDGTPTVDNSNIKLALSAGVGRQFRQQNIPLFDGSFYQIYNDITNTVTYAASSNLTDIIADANGNSLLSNNTYYTIRLFYQLNSNGVGNNVIATRPLGFYATPANALGDPLNYSVTMGDPVKEELIYPLYDLILGRTGSSGVNISLLELRDRRSKLSAGGGGGGSQGISIDEKVRVSASDTTEDYLDPKITVGDEFTKEIAAPGGNESILIKFKGWIFNAARTFKSIISSVNLTADRTFSFPDISGLIAVFGMINPFTFGGQAHGGNKIETFSAAKTFNLNNGNNQYMPVSGNTVLSLSNVLPGTFIIQLQNTATVTSITVDSSFGDALDGNSVFLLATGDRNKITIHVDANSNVEYINSTKTA